MAARASTLAARRCLLLGCAVALCGFQVPAFVGPVTRAARGDRLVARIGAGYLERHGRLDYDKEFEGKDATGRVVTIEFRRRPFGILRYAPGKEGRGAMVQEVVPKSRYPGDPQGQARSGGVYAGMVIKAINGVDMRGVDFEKIMDILSDEIMDPRFKQFADQAQDRQGGPLLEETDLPMKVQFAEIPGWKHEGGELIFDENEGWINDPEITIKDRVRKAALFMNSLTKEQLEKMAELIQIPELGALMDGAKQRLDD